MEDKDLRKLAYSFPDTCPNCLNSKRVQTDTKIIDVAHYGCGTSICSDGTLFPGAECQSSIIANLKTRLRDTEDRASQADQRLRNIWETIKDIVDFDMALTRNIKNPNIVSLVQTVIHNLQTRIQKHKRRLDAIEMLEAVAKKNGYLIANFSVKPEGGTSWMLLQGDHDVVFDGSFVPGVVGDHLWDFEINNRKGQENNDRGKNV